MTQTAIIILLLLYTTTIIYITLKNKTPKNTKEYFLANRKLGPATLAITFIASWWGGGSAIDLVDHAYTTGLNTIWIYAIPALIATALMYTLAPKIRRTATVTQPQILKLRYNTTTATLLTTFILIFMIIGTATQITVLARILAQTLNTTTTTAAITTTAIVVTYSLFGGFKGVVITDIIQFILLLIAAITLLISAYNQTDGITQIINHITQKPSYTNIFHNINQNIAYVITFALSWMIQANVWQRIAAAKTPRTARKMMGISFFGFIPLYLIVITTGMIASLNYTELPQNGIISAMMQTQQNPITSAIIFIGITSAIMSTMDSMINTGALSATLDLYKKHIHPHKPQKHYLNAAKISTIIIATLALLLSTAVDSVLKISWIGADYIATGAFVPLVLGFVWKRGTKQAAVCSMIFGLVFSTVNLIAELGGWFQTPWGHSPTIQVITGMGTSLAIYITVSLLTKPNRAQTQKFFDLIDKKTEWQNT